MVAQPAGFARRARTLAAADTGRQRANLPIVDELTHFAARGFVLPRRAAEALAADARFRRFDEPAAHDIHRVDRYRLAELEVRHLRRRGRRGLTCKRLQKGNCEKVDHGDAFPGFNRA